jgi:CopG family transcriptional regulator / antitoxin EndoAI
MRTTKVLSITLPDAMLKDAKKLAKKENRTMSELVREALRRYGAVQRLKELQSYGEQRARELGINEGDVDRLIHEYRAERRSLLEASGALERKAS